MGNDKPYMAQTASERLAKITNEINWKDESKGGWTKQTIRIFKALGFDGVVFKSVVRDFVGDPFPNRHYDKFEYYEFPDGSIVEEDDPDKHWRDLDTKYEVEGEAAYDDMMSRFYGGSTPFDDKERADVERNQI